MSKKIFVIIPCYNESAVIRQTVTGLLHYNNYEIVVIDDASTDDTENQLKGLSVHYIKHRFNLGQGAALQTGINFALKKGVDYFVTFDADGQHDADDVAGMLKKLEKVDIVFGSRFLPGVANNITGIRKLILKVGCLLNYLFTGILLSDAHNGLRVFNRHAAELIKLKENRMAHASEFLHEVKKYGLRYAEYAVHIRYTEYSRKKGQSLLNSIRIFFELVLNKIFD